MHLRTEDVGLCEVGFIWLRLQEKGHKHLRYRRVVKLPLDQPPVHGVPSALPRVAALLHKLVAAKGEATEYFFQLHGEPRPLTRHMEQWVAAALQRVHVCAPPGFVYLGHSIRKLGASAMAAIGIERHIWMWIGGWTPGSRTPDKHYIDPTVQPTAAAYALYGWALKRCFTTGDLCAEAAPLLADPMESEP